VDRNQIRAHDTPIWKNNLEGEMDRLTIAQVAVCVDACRNSTEPGTIDYPALTEALNAILAADKSAGLQTEPELLWCDVCQRNVAPNHKHDRMTDS
jgi:hypothetical protein